MPRLTVREFMKRHDLLRMLWLDEASQRLFAELPPHQQWELHDFYRPADALIEGELSRHFMAVRQQYPHLAVLAGRHYAVVYGAYLALHRPEVVDQQNRGQEEERVHVVVRPHIDVERFTAALKLIDASVDNDAFK